MKGIIDGIEKIVEIVECGSCSWKEYVVVVVSGVLDVVLVLVTHQMIEYKCIYRPMTILESASHNLCGMF